MTLYDKWKESVVTVYDSQELSTLELLEDITSFTDEIAKGIDDTNDKIDRELKDKTDINGDHKGSWQGLNRPTLSEEGMRATVEKLDKDLLQVNTQLEQMSDNVRTPRLIVKQVLKRKDEPSAEPFNIDYITFKDVFISYNNTFKTTGGVYGLEDHATDSLTQAVYKSSDGGETWVKVGDLVVDTANGIWFNQIFVEPQEETFYLVKTYGGHNFNANEVVSFDNKLNLIGRQAIDKNRWLSNNQAIDAMHSLDWSKKVVMFCEYGTSLDTDVYRIFKTTDRGKTWTISKSFTGDWHTHGSGEIRHFHVVQADPYTGHWWVGTGDMDYQCKILRSIDDGLTWEVMFEGSQRERTCCFVFEKDYIYYGMDSTNISHIEDIKIVRINRSDLSRTDVAIVDKGYAVYSLTKTLFPEGFLIWTCYEGVGVSVESDEIIVQFYDYLTEKTYPVAHFNLKGSTGIYKGFMSASRHQEYQTGNIFVLPTPNLLQFKHGHSTVSAHIKVNVTT